MASVKAYFAALNKMLVATGKYAQQPEVAATLNGPKVKSNGGDENDHLRRNAVFVVYRCYLCSM